MALQVVGLRAMMTIGCVLLGVPTPLYLLSADIAPVMAITLVRGIGFAFVVMAGATLAADLAPEGRLARSVSLYGAAAALPNLAALAGGVWIAHAWGFPVVFWASGTVPLLGAGLAFLLPSRHRGHFALSTPTTGMGAIAAPVGLFLMTAGSFGAATTFLPVAAADTGVTSLALLAASVALVLARLAAGAVGDRYGAGRVLLVAVLACAAGLALIALSLTTGTGLLLLGATLLGAGFGAAQNDSFVLTVQRLGEGRSGTASTIWNVAYDGGLGLGAFALGGVAGHAGYTGAFLAMAAVVAVVAVGALTLAAGRRMRNRATAGGAQSLDDTPACPSKR